MTDPGTTTAAGAPAPVHPTARHWVLFAVVCLLFSTTWLAIRVGLRDLPPLRAAGLRFLVAFPILLAVARARRVRFPRTLREAVLPTLLSLWMFALPFAFIYYAERTVPSGLASVLFATYAIFIALLAHFTLPDERLTWARGAGVLVGFLGVVVVFQDRLQGSRSWVGETLMLITALVQGGAAIAVRRTRETVPAILLSCFGAGVGAAVLLAASWLFERDAPFRLTATALGSILYLAVFGSVIAFTLLFHLMHELGPTRVAMTVYITPVLALFWGWLVLSEPLGSRLLLGVALIVGGVWLANRATAPAARRGAGTKAAGPTAVAG